ncbi:MAG: hypothetical protein KDD66_11705 [Bdellovibrionales bacterium]|nr:hypothetical protein [Bdellovibrionales bacterium]
MNRAILFISAAFIVFASPACMSAAEHSQSLHSSNERELTVGTVQRQITKGMSQASVAEALGSPNIVAKDEDGDETWIYDRIASEVSFSSDSGGVVGGAGAAGGGSDVMILGGLGGSYSRSAGAAASTQKTLTVVIKFNGGGRVKDFSYHASKF